MTDAPVLVLSSNHPQALAALLDSLMRQDGAVIDRRAVFLFQDGGRDATGVVTHWSDAVLLANLDMFRRVVPHGIPLASYRHLGPVLNRDRAERFAFESLSADAAVFLGDDLVLGRNYLRTLDRLLALALGSARIAAVSADGDSRASLSDQLAEPSRLTAMDGARGIGLLRRHWLRQSVYRSAYLGLVAGQDYAERDRAAIQALLHDWGVDASDTSYQAMVAHTCVLTGSARVGTYACFARHLAWPPAPSALALPHGFGAPAMIEEDLCRPVTPTDEELATLMAAAAGYGGVYDAASRA